jgi:Tn3 transposase DDE domain
LSAAICRPRSRAKRGGNPGWRPRAKIPASAPPADPPGPSRATGPSPTVARNQRHVLPTAPAHQRPVLRHRGRTPGHTTDSLLIARLHASSRPSTLATALHEYGRLVRTIYICRYVAGEELRRRYVRVALGHCLAGNTLEGPARQLTLNSHPGRPRITGRSAARRPPASRTATEHKVGDPRGSAPGPHLLTVSVSKPHSGMSARSGRASMVTDAPRILLGQAPRDRTWERLPCSTLSRSVPARLICRALGPPHRPCLVTYPATREALSLLGKGLDLRKLVAGAGFEPATSGL